MKKLLATFLSIFALFPFIAYAQLNVFQGGTGTTSIVSGSFVVGRDTFRLQSTQSNLFWDVNSKLLGIGSTTPVGQLSIEMGTSSYPFWIGDKGTTTPFFVVGGNGNVGISTTSPSTAFGIQSIANFVLSATSTIYTAFSSPLLSITSTTATSTFSNGIQLTDGCVRMPSGTCLTTGSGITSLNGLAGATQTFVDDTNVSMVSAGTTHTLTWLSTLSVARGGTGVGALSVNGLLIGNGTGAVSATSSPTIGWLYATTTTATSTFLGGLIGANNIFGSFVRATTTLEIPIGTNPTASTSGDILVDTSDDQLIYKTASTSVRVLSAYYEKSFAVSSSTPFTSSDNELNNLLLWRPRDNIVITEIHCITNAGTQVITLQQTNVDGTITNLATNGIDGSTTITCATADTRDDGVLSNATTTSGKWIALSWGTAASGPTKISITWYYTILRD